MPLTQPVATETHQAEQEILTQPSDGKKMRPYGIANDPLTRKFQGMPLTQPIASETHQAEQEILAQPSDGIKCGPTG
jgi:hypothetical protein